MRLVPNLREAIIKGWEYVLNTGKVVEQANWQGVKASRPMFEALDYDFKALMPRSIPEAMDMIKPNLPWADVHFLERVGGEPLNPPPSHKIWPFGNTENFIEGEQFNHTYPERFWAKMDDKGKPRQGVRYYYGNFKDVLDKLKYDPHTRQAFLPIWFPEDTGKPPHLRVPCTIGYHFLVRDGRIDITYWMRSLDMLRHFQDDIYLCYLLANHVSTQLPELQLKLGYMKFHAVSAHIFDGEQKLLERKINELKK